MDVPVHLPLLKCMVGTRVETQGSRADAPGEFPMQPHLSILPVEIPHITQPAFLAARTDSVSLFLRMV